MPDLHEYAFAEIARIDSKEEIVVHLGRLAEPMELPELAELLRIPAIYIFNYLTLPLNEAFARRLYASVRATYKDLPGASGAVELPDDAELEQFAVVEWTRAVWQVWRGEGQPYFWELPPVDLYLPRVGSLTGQLPLIYARGTSRDRIIKVERVELLLKRAAALKPAVEKLEAAIERKFKEKIGAGKSFAELFGGISSLHTIVGLQARHWDSELKRGEISERTWNDYVPEIANVRTAIDNFENAVWRKFEAELIDPERAAADELLDLIGSNGDPDVQWAIDVAHTRLDDLAVDEADEVLELTHRACSALARSARVKRFVDEHVVDMLEESCLDLPPSVEALLRREGGQLGQEVVTEWKEHVAALRRAAGAPTNSVLRNTQRATRAYRLGLSATNAILEQGVVAQVMTYLLRGHGDKPALTAMQYATRGFALIVLRGLASNAVQHRAKPGELFVAGGQRLSTILQRLNEIDADVTKRAAQLAAGQKLEGAWVFWHEKGGLLKDLQVRPTPRSPLGAVARLSVSAIVLGLAARSAFGEGEIRGAELVGLGSALLNFAEHLGRSQEFVHAGAPPRLQWIAGDDALQKFDRSMKHLASLGAAVGALANFAKARAVKGRPDKWHQYMIEHCGGVSNTAVALGQAMMGPMQAIIPAPGVLREAEQKFIQRIAAWMSRYGAFANAFGVALGVGAFIAQIVYDEFIDIGTRKVFFATVDSIAAMPRARGLATDIVALRQAAADNVGCMSALRRAVGEPTDDPMRGIPTFWKAAKLGFSDRAVQLLFDADAADVSVCLQGFYK